LQEVNCVSVAAIPSVVPGTDVSAPNVNTFHIYWAYEVPYLKEDTASGRVEETIFVHKNIFIK